MTPAQASRLGQKAAQVVVQADSPPSPCTSVCRMSAATGLCEGCLRTLEEIAAWSRMPDDGKRKVWQTIGRRAAEAGRLAAGDAS